MEIKYWQLGEIVENKYKIKKILGQGTTGISYEVEHFDWETSLRLKVFHPNTYTPSIRHVCDRWVSMESCTHIANAYYWDCLQKQYCLLGEFIPGISLSEYQKQQHTLAEKIDIAIQLAFGLSDAHSARLFHGNLISTNVIIWQSCTYIQDFVGGCPQSDLIQYGKLLQNLFWPPITESESIESLPSLSSFIAQLIEGEEQDWKKIIWHLKDFYEYLGVGTYKLNPIIPIRLDIESLHKQAIAYYEAKQEKMARNIWNLAGENHPPSIHALWNSYLLGLREGTTSMDLFMRTMEELTAFEHTQILYAQGELALETGLHINDTIEKFQNSMDTSHKLQRVHAELRYRVRQYDEAIRILETIRQTSDWEKDDFYRLAIAYYSQENYDKAREICQNGLNIHPSHGLLYLLEAVLSYMLDTPNVFEEKFSILEEKYSSLFWVLIHLGDYYAGRGIYNRQIHSKNIEKARDFYQRALAISPQNTRAIRGFKHCGGTQLPEDNSYCLHLNEWSQIRYLTGHASIVTALAITPDGRWIVSGDCDGNLFLWNALAGTLVTGLIGHTKHITSIAITNNGSKIASASWDHTIRIWEIPSGSCQWEIQGHFESISKIAFSPDGNYLISGSWDSTAKIWDVNAHSLYATLQHPGVWVRDVAILPGNEWAITNTEQEEICLWNIARNEMTQRIRGISFCLGHDGKSVALSYYSSQEIWEMPATKLENYIKIPNKELCVGISQDNIILLTKNENDFICFWDMVYKRELKIAHTDEATYCVITPQSNFMATSYGTNIYLWENIAFRPFPLFRHAHFFLPEVRSTIKLPDMLGQTYRQAEILYQQKCFQEAFDSYKSLAHIPGYESSSVLFQHMDDCCLRQPILRKEVQNIHLRGHVVMVGVATSSAIACQGKIVLIGNDDDPIHQWNMKSSYITHRWEGHNRCVSSISVTKDGSKALSGAYDGTVIVWNLDSHNDSHMIEIGDTWVNHVAMDPLGKYGLIGTKDGRVILWNLQNFTQELLYENQENPVITTLIKNDFGIASQRDGNIRIWELSTRRLVAQHRIHERYITALDASHDGRRILSSSRNGSIFLWETESGKILKEYRHEGEVVKYIRFTYDKFFISLAKDGGLRIWHLESPEPLAYYYAHDNPITTASISEDGRFLVSADETKILKLWELEWEWTPWPNRPA